MSELKKKTCKRCNGTGLWSKTSPVVHCGSPGGCYQCDCNGELFWIARELIDIVNKKNIASRLTELEEYAASAKAAFERRAARLAVTHPKGIERRKRHLDETLAELREDWKKLKAAQNKSAKKGKWVSYLELPKYERALKNS